MPPSYTFTLLTFSFLFFIHIHYFFYLFVPYFYYSTFTLFLLLRFISLLFSIRFYIRFSIIFFHFISLVLHIYFPPLFFSIFSSFIFNSFSFISSYSSVILLLHFFYSFFPFHSLLYFRYYFHPVLHIYLLLYYFSSFMLSFMLSFALYFILYFTFSFYFFSTYFLPYFYFIFPLLYSFSHFLPVLHNYILYFHFSFSTTFSSSSVSSSFLIYPILSFSPFPILLLICSAYPSIPIFFYYYSILIKSSTLIISLYHLLLSYFIISRSFSCSFSASTFILLSISTSASPLFHSSSLLPFLFLYLFIRSIFPLLLSPQSYTFTPHSFIFPNFPSFPLLLSLFCSLLISFFRCSFIISFYFNSRISTNSPNNFSIGITFLFYSSLYHLLLS